VVAHAEEFIAALDKEREKVIHFYESKEKELEEEFKTLQNEISVLEERELEDVIEEEDEDAEDEGGNDGDHFRSDDVEAGRRFSHEDHAGGASRFASGPPKIRKQPSGFMRRLAAMRPHGLGLNRRESRDETDLLEAALMPALHLRTPSQDPGSLAVNNGPKSPKITKRASFAAPTSPSHRRKSSDDYFSRERSGSRSNADRRLSMSSVSSGDWGHRAEYRGNLGLVPMDCSNLGLSSSIFSEGAGGGGGALSASVAGSLPPIAYVWTANSDYGKVIRIGFKKRISALWLEAHSLRQYVELNMTAFEKILKKYDKNTNSKVGRRVFHGQGRTALTDRIV
jgi:phosphate transporter